MKKYCKHCSHEFEARRKNHLYCCSSCKTLASYKINDYKYIAGHYKKDNNFQTKRADSVINPYNKVDGKLKQLINSKNQNMLF